ncbi:hypothetical protein JL100_015890 [Skermanella mucosa]|uniref:hypothetical protein n=1 Tax=Skermanella mucosa TaxID=1789672 RepID=UPI00192C0336|nr:hypothetical protein [Skermanella mucosa]UEM18599.1 hypothetical protein JL100_015890 [Skermanella mucosa]
MRNEPGSREEAERRHGRGRQPVPPLEWATALLGLVMTVGSVGLILYDAFDQDTPPMLKAHVERHLRIEGRHLVEFVVVNDGGSTAAKVTVEGTLGKGGTAVETASTTFDYVPAHSQARGGVLFDHDPGTHDLAFEAKSYTEP